MARKAPTNSVVKRLFAKSGNKCAYDDCLNTLVDNDGNVLGEICHIEAANENGPRYNPESDDEYRRSYDNLILLCERHHKIVDKNPEKYTVQRLKDLKNSHQANNSSSDFVVTEKAIKNFINKIQDYSIQENTHSGNGNQYVINAETVNLDTGDNRDNESEKLVENEQEKKSKLDAIIDYFKNHRIYSFILFIIIILTGLGALTDSFSKIIEFTNSLSKENNELQVEDIKLSAGETITLSIPEKQENDSQVEILAILTPKSAGNYFYFCYDIYLSNPNESSILIVGLEYTSSIRKPHGDPAIAKIFEPNATYNITYNIGESNKVIFDRPYRIPSRGDGAIRIKLNPNPDSIAPHSIEYYEGVIHLMEIKLIDSKGKELMITSPFNEE